MTREDVIEILERFVLGAKPCSQRDIVDACASAYRMLKEQPSLPSNLDEAAFTYENELWESGFNECGYSPQEVNDAFKAGAEWMAGQGWHEEAVIKGSDDVVWLNYNVELPIDLAKYFKVGDKVIVQIRKAK